MSTATPFTVPTIFSAIDKFTAPVRAMGRAMESQMVIAERSIRKVNRASAEVAQKSLGYGAAISAPLILATKSALDFHKQMAEVATLVDTTKESMGDMGREVLKLATKIPRPINDLTEGLYNVRSAGIEASKAMETLEVSGKLATAGKSSVVEAVNIQTSAMNAFKSEGLASTKIADLLFKTVKAGKTDISQLAQGFGAVAPTVQAAGVKIDEFMASVAAMTSVGTPASVAMNQIKASISSLEKPSGDMQKIFDHLGVTSAQNLIDTFGGMVPAMNAVNKAGDNMGINLAKAWGSTEAKGAVTALLGSVNAAYADTLNNMRHGVNALDEAFLKAQLGDPIQLAINNIQALAITLGTSLVPMVTKAVEKFSPMIRQFIDWAKANRDTIDTVVKFTAILGGSLLVIGIVAGAISGITTIILGFQHFTKLAAGAQWLWNAAMAANPIGLIVVAIAGLIALVVTIIAKYDEWGAALTFLLGPLGMIINLIQSFRRNWDMITEAFTKGGILAGLKAIGKVFLDSILMPMQQLMKIIANFTGFEWANNAANSIDKMRAELGVAEPVNPAKSQAEAISRRIEEKSFSVDWGTPPPGVKVKDSDDNFIPVNVYKTYQFGM